MRHTAVVSSKGQLVIPAALRKEMGMKAGFRVNFRRKGNDLIISPDNFDAVLVLCGKYEGLFSEEDWMEEKRLEREREDRKLAEA